MEDSGEREREGVGVRQVVRRRQTMGQVVWSRHNATLLSWFRHWLPLISPGHRLLFSIFDYLHGESVDGVLETKAATLNST